MHLTNPAFYRFRCSTLPSLWIVGSGVPWCGAGSKDLLALTWSLIELFFFLLVARSIGEVALSASNFPFLPQPPPLNPPRYTAATADPHHLLTSATSRDCDSIAGRRVEGPKDCKRASRRQSPVRIHWLIATPDWYWAKRPASTKQQQTCPKETG